MTTSKSPSTTFRILLKLCALVIALMVVLALLGRAIDYERTNHGAYYQQSPVH